MRTYIRLCPWLFIGLFLNGCLLFDDWQSVPDSECTFESENELLINPSAEEGLLGWESDGDFQPAVEVTPFDGCYHFFASAGDEVSMWQTVDLADAGISTEDLDAGTLRFVAGGYQRSYVPVWGELDAGTIEIRALDQAGYVLGSFTGPTIIAPEWTEVRIHEALPAGSRQIVYRFTSVRYDGSDSDGYLDGAFLWLDLDADLDGVGMRYGDCDDRDPSRRPGLAELCDGLDNDCDELVDESSRLYADRDGDGFGDSGDTMSFSPTEGYVASAGDCDDQDPAVHPAAEDSCDHRDQNCDGRIEAACNLLKNPGAEDGLEGWIGSYSFTVGREVGPYEGSYHFFAGVSTTATLRQTVELAAAGVSLEAIDRGGLLVYGGGFQRSYSQSGSEDVGEIELIVLDESGRTLATALGEAVDEIEWILTEIRAPLPAGARKVVFSFTSTRLNGEDNDGYLDAAFLWIDEDVDGDGFGPTNGDCNDLDPQVAPGSNELCDGLDNNCDGLMDESPAVLYADADGDGHGTPGQTVPCGEDGASVGDDCDDQDPDVHPGAAEACDHVDNDCDGLIEQTCNLLVNPGAEEGVAGWTADPVFGVRSDPAPAEGNYYFYAGAVALATLSQTVDLVDAGHTPATLDAGTLSIVAGGYQRSYPQVSNRDQGQIEVVVRGAQGESLLELAGPVVDEDQDWVLIQMRERLPAGARSLTYTFTATLISGQNNDAYLDGAFLWVE